MIRQTESDIIEFSVNDAERGGINTLIDGHAIMGGDGAKPMAAFLELCRPQMDQDTSISNGIRANFGFTVEFSIVGDTKMAEKELYFYEHTHSNTITHLSLPLLTPWREFYSIFSKTRNSIKTQVKWIL